MIRNPEQRRKATLRSMKRLHGRRRRRGVCINRDIHGPAFKGGRCRACWEAKLAAERDAYANRKHHRVRVS